jgi:hypothetical protein
MKVFIIAILLIAGVASCKEGEKVSFTARPDPNTSTSGTLGSSRATDGVKPSQYIDPRIMDTLLVKH